MRPICSTCARPTCASASDHFASASAAAAAAEAGSAVEVATVGREGMLGLPVFLGVMQTSLEAFQQIAGDHLRMEAKLFRREIEENGPLRKILQLYTQAVIMQVAQGSACNRSHSIEQRCARWLLQTSSKKPVFSFQRSAIQQLRAAKRGCESP